MTNEMFDNIVKIVEDSSAEQIDVIENAKNVYENIILQALNNITFHYETINSFKLLGLDDYLLKTSYENNTPIRYFACLNVNADVFYSGLVKKKKKRKKKNIEEIIVGNKLTVQDFAILLKKELSKFMQEGEFVIAYNGMVKVILNNCSIQIICSYEYEKNIINYYKGENWFKINISQFYDNYIKKQQETNNNYSKMCRIFKAFEKELIINNISSIYISNNFGLVENLLYNAPSNLFSSLQNEMFLKTCSYLINCNFASLKTLDGKPMFDEIIYKKESTKNLCRKIMYSYRHFEEFVEMAEKQEQENDYNDNYGEENVITTQNKINNKQEQENEYNEFKNKLSNNK